MDENNFKDNCMPNDAGNDVNDEYSMDSDDIKNSQSDSSISEDKQCSQENSDNGGSSDSAKQDDNHINDADNGANDSSTEENKGNDSSDDIPDHEGASYSNWSYEQMHEPIDLSPVKSKNKGKKLAITVCIVFAAAMSLLIFALLSGILFATPEDIQGDTVINISVSDSAPSPLEDGSASPEALEAFKDSTVVISADSSTGTGIIFSENGYIVTNYHVIEGAQSIQVLLYNGATYKANVVGYIEANDIAVIKINAKGLKYATFATGGCYLGQRVYAVGNPAGSSFSWSVTSGIVSATEREAKFHDDNGSLERIMRVIQTDAPVNPGNSGGPLINSSCQVVGIITMRLSNDYVGMGFAIPADDAVELIKSILSNEGDKSDDSPAQMGIVGLNAVSGSYYYHDEASGRIYQANSAFVSRYPDKCFTPCDSGIYVVTLTPGYDSENKLKVGDVIIDIEGSGNKDLTYLGEVLQSKKAGDTVSIKVNRNGEILYFEILLK